MLYKVTVGRDSYLGTPEEVVAWMSRAKGAPAGGPDAYMRGVAARIRERDVDVRVDPSSPLSFLLSLSRVGLLVLEERAEASPEREDAEQLLDSGFVTFGDGVEPEDL